jgi:hypothetical protein
MGQAHVRVALVTADKADLLAYRVSAWGLAVGGTRWFVTREPQDAQVWVYFCGEAMAQLRVCFVSSQAQARWAREGHPLARLFT